MGYIVLSGMFARLRLGVTMHLKERTSDLGVWGDCKAGVLGDGH